MPYLASSHRALSLTVAERARVKAERKRRRLPVPREPVFHLSPWRRDTDDIFKATMSAELGGRRCEVSLSTVYRPGMMDGSLRETLGETISEAQAQIRQAFIRPVDRARAERIKRTMHACWRRRLTASMKSSRLRGEHG